MLKDTMEEIAALAESFPKIVLVLFGMNGARVDTALGAYQSMVFWSNLLAFFFAGFLGVYSVAREEKFGTSEFLFSKPYKRSTVVWAKIWASVTNLSIFALSSGIMSYLFIILPLGDMSIVGTHILTTAGMFITQIVLFAIGLFISGFAKDYKTASLFTMLTVIVFYMINFVLDYTGTMDHLNFLTPVRYFDVVSVSKNGLNFFYILLSCMIFLLSCSIASRLYTRKDFHSSLKLEYCNVASTQKYITHKVYDSHWLTKQSKCHYNKIYSNYQ
ncbi:ABC-2 family transporter protein (plasmid) [Peptoclostridium acidaminophilum DSM 3953]|uniref:ABC-2 family transporter protein n=1 Tax=Peptoclostridium acidaminophilum DSM 3953 TaxID=1286171 RepID=W8TNL7_PEPAC|nr:ABC transporter permease subunit [Peptoclostridium acidaminophilum]AHM57757.1 ABC-2 family transporter protein [Peptoclostridium acidaminophilum DSM 3953]